MQKQSVGIDLGKTTSHLVALGAAGKVLVRKKFHAEAVASLHREHADLSDRLGGVLRRPLPRRGAAQAGHDVRLIPAQFLKPFVKSNKNDFVEAQEAPSI